MTDERTRPPRSGSERDILLGFLDHHRETLLWKIEGLDDEQLRRSVVPSGWSLLGLVKHVAYVERWWFRAVFAGQNVAFPWSDEDPDADWRVEPGETAEEITALYAEECRRSRDAIEGKSFDEFCCMPGHDDRNLRQVVAHMVEETARHNGHADIARELIDGATGV